MASANFPFTVLLVGRTGMGKSTTGNKLLNVATEDNPAGSTQIKQIHPAEGREDFETNPNPDSVTKKCSVMSSMTEGGEVRVLDTEGFAGSDVSNILLDNLRVVREIAGVSSELKLSFDRVLYFLPARGQSPRADKTLQDEIEVLWHFFGNAIFENMVLAFTMPDLGDYVPKDFVLSPKKAEASRSVFGKAMELALKGHELAQLPPRPPVVYIPLDSSAILTSIKNAPVFGEKPFYPRFRKDVCAKCTCEFFLRDSTVVEVKVEGISYKPADTKCHPFFIPKYSMVKRIFGGIAHVAVLGMAKVHEKRTGKPTWPGFFSSEEVCSNCKTPPGERGCMSAMDTYENQAVQHSNELNKVVINQ